MKRYPVLSGFVMILVPLISTGAQVAPSEWRKIVFPTQCFQSIEDTSDSSGMYLVYVGCEREDVMHSVSEALLRAGFAEVGTAFDGTVAGFAREDEKLALKVDQFGKNLYVAVFDERGKEPLLHAALFGRAQLGEEVSGEEARSLLLRELENDEPSKDAD